MTDSDPEDQEQATVQQVIENYQRAKQDLDVAACGTFVARAEQGTSLRLVKDALESGSEQTRKVPLT